MQRIHLYFLPPPSLLHSWYPYFSLPQSLPVQLKCLYTFFFLLLLRQHWAIPFLILVCWILLASWIIFVRKTGQTAAPSAIHTQGDVPRPGSCHMRLSHVKCGAECAKQSSGDKGEMAKTMASNAWSLPAPSCRTPIRKQYFCASSAGRTKPLKPDNPQIPGKVFMASVGWIHPHFKAERIRLYFFPAFVHQKKPTLAEPCYELLPASVV